MLGLLLCEFIVFSLGEMVWFHTDQSSHQDKLVSPKFTCLAWLLFSEEKTLKQKVPLELAKKRENKKA